MKSTGKRFEENFKKSVPKDIFYYRFRDGTSSWDKNVQTRFQQTNICDCLMFDGNYLYLLELKSTKGKSLPFGNIKKHQIDDLLKACEYKNTICGFVIEYSELNTCYFLEIRRFKEFLDSTQRKSLPVDYCLKKGIKIDIKRKKINSEFDIEKFLKEVVKKYEQ